MAYAYLGIDIAKRKFDVALRLPDGRVRVKAFANDAAGYAGLRGWITRYHAGPVHACLEATGTYGDGLATTLADAGLVVSVVNPAIIEAYARSCLTRTKTDPSDARLLAQFCATQQPRPWVPLPPEVRALQALVRRLDALEWMRTQEHNRLAADPPAEVRDSITHMIALLEAEKQVVRTRLREHIDQHPHLRQQRDLLTSIPGIGDATAAVLLAEFGPMGRFRQARAAAAFAGVVPREGRSGTSLRRRPRLSKLGAPAIRKALYFPALTALRCNPIAQRLQARLLADGKHRMLIVGAVMRKLVHLAFGVLKTGQPFRADFALTR